MIQQSPLGVMGCLPTLPSTFPIDYPENSGNMVHANAPFRIFDSTFFIKDYNYSALGYKNFNEFVNSRCSHLVLTLANTLKLGDTDGTKYRRLLDFLEKVEKPVVVFGLGIQSKEAEIENATLPDEAIKLVRYLSEKSPLLGVRGDFTKRVLEKLCGISNIFVTGCPSIFSNQNAFKLLHENIKIMNGRPAFSGTRYFDANENRLLQNAISKEEWLIEPVNKFNHHYYLKVINNTDTFEDIPYFFKKHIKKDSYSKAHYLRNYFLSQYRIFRNIDDWYQFNTEAVSYTYGTRFHVNMASLVSGKPALWLTHDARTRELVEFMHLPNIDVNHQSLLDEGCIKELLKYDEFFDHLPSLTANFNHYLESNNLPKLKPFN